MQKKNFFNINISMTQNQTKEIAEIPALLDSGAGGTFINQNYTWKMNYELTEMEKPVKAYNIDRMENKKGTIKYFVFFEFSLKEKNFKERFYITKLGRQRVILRLPWLKKNNPEINWKASKLEWQTNNEPKRFLIFKQKEGKKEEEPVKDNSKFMKTSEIPSILEEIDEEEWMNRTINILDTTEEHILESMEEYIETMWINKKNLATELAMAENLKKAELPIEEIIPKKFHEYLDIFDEQKANW